MRYAIRLMGRRVSFTRLAPNLIRGDGLVDVRKPKNEMNVTGPIWMLLTAELPHPATFRTRHQRKEQWHSGDCSMLIPRGSILDMQFLPARYAYRIYVGTSPLPESAPKQGMMATSIPAGPMHSLDEVLNFIGAQEWNIPIESIQETSSIARRTKEILDKEHLTIFLSVSSIAKRLNASREVVSRYFRKAYGLSPQKYLLQVRISAALKNRFFHDLPAVETGQKAGFRHTSQFFRHFRRLTGSSPSACHTSDQEPIPQKF